jgi:tRNA pseudouridine13 synthase
VAEPRPDELNAGRFRVNVAFTLGPGSYATLVVKRLFWWTLEARRQAVAATEPAHRPTPEELHERRRKTGFLAKKRERKARRRQQKP